MRRYSLWTVGNRPLALWLSFAFVIAAAFVAPPRAARAATCVGGNVPPPMPAPSGAPPRQSGLHAAWWGQSGYPTLCPGERTTLRVSYRNVGDRVWSGALLGTWRPVPGQDKPSPLGGDGTSASPSTGWARYNRPAVQSPASVAPDEVATFEFMIQAPTTPGVYTLGVRPLFEGVTWLEDFGIFWLVIVLNADGTPLCKSSVAPPVSLGPWTGRLQSGVHAAWAGQSGYAKLCPGERTTVTVSYVNNGSVAWSAGQVLLGTRPPEPGHDRPSLLGGDGTQGSPNTGWPRYNRPAAQAAAAVPPGQTATFQFAIQAPQRPGVYWLGVRPVIEGVQWLDDYGVFWEVTVQNLDGTPPVLTCVDCWPLAGAPLNGASASRRPISVRIDNAPLARPHYGISSADLVFELLVEGFITRLAAVFHSQGADTIGGIRSARLSDRYITPMLRGALGYSGATLEETALIQQDARDGKYLDLNAVYTNAYYRVSFRPIPYNEFSSTALLRQAIAEKGGGPVDVPRWGFLADADHSPYAGGMIGSATATRITIPYRDFARVRYEYDPGSRSFARFQADVEEVDAANGAAIAAKNVVVILTDITTTNIIEDNLGSRGLDMRLTGTGQVIVFRDGRRRDGTWSRATILEPFTFATASGGAILLSAGQTWIHVVPTDWVIPSQ